jgi:D-3-phosphoglycerate dehydrogenase
MRGKVFISTTSFGEFDSRPLQMLKEAGLEVQLNPYHRTLSKDESMSLGEQSEGLIAGTEALDEEVLRKLKYLRVISRCGAGLDNIDLEAAKRQGIQVFNTPGGPTIAVAELTVALILSLLRHIPRMDREMRHQTWQKRMGNLLQGKKVGIIGFGRIGQKVAELVLGLGAQVAYSDPAVDEVKTGCLRMSLDKLLSWSDIVTIHASGKEPLLGYKELRRMRQGSWLVNCARGGAVDEAALYRVLQEGWLSGAAVDVFQEEPYAGSLAELDNVILTPHIGSYAIESRVEMEVQAVRNLIEGLKR